MKKKWLKILMAVTALALVLCQYACSGSARKNSSSDSDTARMTTVRTIETSSVMRLLSFIYRSSSRYPSFGIARIASSSPSFFRSAEILTSTMRVSPR